MWVTSLKGSRGSPTETCGFGPKDQCREVVFVRTETKYSLFALYIKGGIGQKCLTAKEI